MRYVSQWRPLPIRIVTATYVLGGHMYDLTITLSPVLFVIQWAQREQNPVGKIYLKEECVRYSWYS